MIAVPERDTKGKFTSSCVYFRFCLFFYFFILLLPAGVLVCSRPSGQGLGESQTVSEAQRRSVRSCAFKCRHVVFHMMWVSSGRTGVIPTQPCKNHHVYEKSCFSSRLAVGTVAGLRTVPHSRALRIKPVVYIFHFQAK